MAEQPGLGNSQKAGRNQLYVKKAFEDSDSTYGYRRVHAQLLR